MKPILLLLLTSWLALAAAWAWLCEPLLAWAMPGFHSVEHWLTLLVGGELLLTMLALVILWRLRRRPRT